MISKLFRTSDITNFSKLSKFGKSGLHHVNYKYFTKGSEYALQLIYKFDFNFLHNASPRILTRWESKHTLVYLEKSFKVKTFVRNCHK